MGLEGVVDRLDTPKIEEWQASSFDIDDHQERLRCLMNRLRAFVSASLSGGISSLKSWVDPEKENARPCPSGPERTTCVRTAIQSSVSCPESSPLCRVIGITLPGNQVSSSTTYMPLELMFSTEQTFGVPLVQ